MSGVADQETGLADPDLNGLNVSSASRRRVENVHRFDRPQRGFRQSTNVDIDIYFTFAMLYSEITGCSNEHLFA